MQLCTFCPHSLNRSAVHGLRCTTAAVFVYDTTAQDPCPLSEYCTFIMCVCVYSYLCTSMSPRMNISMKLFVCMRRCKMCVEFRGTVVMRGISYRQ